MKNLKSILRTLQIEALESKDFDAIIFDYDRTIAKVPVDWSAARVALRDRLVSHFNLEPPEGLRVDELEKWGLDEGGLSPAQVFSLRTKLEEAVPESHEPVTEVVEFIRDLPIKHPEIRLFVLSNNLRKTVLTGLEKLGLTAFFTHVLGVDNTLDPKPGTTGFKMLKERFDLQTERTLFIGDSDGTDGEFCRQLGISFINITSL